MSSFNSSYNIWVNTSFGPSGIHFAFDLGNADEQFAQVIFGIDELNRLLAEQLGFTVAPPRQAPPRQPPSRPRQPLKDTRTRSQKLADLAARATTDGEREAALIALAKVRAKEGLS